MDWVQTLGFAMGSAWLSGINLYATVLTLGLLQRLQVAHLPGDLARLSDSWVIGLAGALYLIEFLADKVPGLDSIWDAVHTFIRIPAGAVLAASAFADFDPKIQFLAVLIGGGTALSSHRAKATARLAANMSPEPFSNIALSLVEDVVAFGSTILMVFHPVVILILVSVFVLIAILIAPRVYRDVQRLFRKPSIAKATVARFDR
jgi:hypothetical protein